MTSAMEHAWPTPEARAAYAAVVAAHAAAARQTRRILLGFFGAGAVIGVLVGLVAPGWWSTAGWVMAASIALVILSNLGLPHYPVTAREYFAIPGTRTADGKPRCIHCGHVGVYTHGAYAEDTKYHDCSDQRCAKNMYCD